MTRNNTSGAGVGARAGDGEQDTAVSALGTPGSTKVSSLLMQDTVAAGEVSVAAGLRPGSLGGSTALFANPYLDGKEEALAIDGGGKLTYLQRDPVATGWLQTDVFADGAVVKAREVVVVVHPQDRSVWAVYSPATAGPPRALLLRAAKTTTGTACRWEARTQVVVPADPKQSAAWLSRLHVSYQDRTPIITAMDSTGRVVTIAAAFGNLTVNRFPYTVHPATFEQFGQLDELVGGQVTVLPGALPAGPASIAYLRFGKNVVRYSSGDGQGPISIADDAVQLAGVYPVTAQSDVGLIYLDNRGGLSSWNRMLDGGRMATSWSGLGFVTAATWTDADEMAHVYGLNGAGSLQVVHEDWCDGTGAPHWSSVDSPTGDSVTACIGLVPNVAAFSVDPYPDEQPNELVMHEGAKAPHEKFSFYMQDINSTRWSRDKVRLPSGGDPHVVTHYVSTVTIVDKRGKPMGGLPVKVSADALAEICIDGASYLVGPAHSVAVSTTLLGKVVIASPADGLLPATLHVDAVGLANGAVIQPAAAIHDYLAGTGTLPSRKGLFDDKALLAAEVDGVPIVDKDHQAGVTAAVDGTHQIFKMASGATPMSRLTGGLGGADPIHGFSVGSSPTAHLDGSDCAVYREFDSPEKLDAHVRAIRKLPQYGGIWDQFVNWAGDVWEGIKNGVVKVYDVVVETTAKVFIWIGEKIVELVDFVIETVQDAVRTVEAVISKVVDSVHKVVDWLKALFSFKDIWDTKTALQKSFGTMWSYGSTVLGQCAKVEHGWFNDQRANATAAFADLKKSYGGRAAGDMANQISPLKDPSGHVLTSDEVAGNPQAAWLLDRGLGERMSTAAQSAVILTNTDSPIPEVFGGFGAAVTDAQIPGKLGKKLGDPDRAAAGVSDPVSPDPGATASVDGLIDLMAKLVDETLSAMDDAAATALKVGMTVADSYQDVLGIKIKCEPLRLLYGWVARQAKQPEPAELTLGDLLFLIGGFWVTTVYKLIEGVENAPFPGGVVPHIPAPPGHAEHGSSADEAVTGPITGFQIACGAMALLGAVFDTFNDIAPLVPTPKGEGKNAAKATLLVLAGGSFVFSAAFMNCFASLPPVLGVGWDDARGAFKAAWAIQMVALGLSAASILCFCADWVFDWGLIDSPHFRNICDVLLGPIAAFILALGAMIAGILACVWHGDSPMIAVQLSFAAAGGLIQIIRVRFGPKWKERVGACALIDGFFTACAGLMLIHVGTHPPTAPALPGPRPVAALG